MIKDDMQCKDINIQIIIRHMYKKMRRNKIKKGVDFNLLSHASKQMHKDFSIHSRKHQI